MRTLGWSVLFLVLLSVTSRLADAYPCYIYPQRSSTTDSLGYHHCFLPPPGACLSNDSSGWGSMCTGSCTPLGQCDGLNFCADFCYTHDINYIYNKCGSSSWLSFNWDCQRINLYAVFDGIRAGFSQVFSWMTFGYWGGSSPSYTARDTFQNWVSLAAYGTVLQWAIANGYNGPINYGVNSNFGGASNSSLGYNSGDGGAITWGSPGSPNYFDSSMPFNGGTTADGCPMLGCTSGGGGS